ncbi:1,3-beta-glucanase [Photobacterium swingsii]|uniref:Beta-glucanase n=1 Tax=Photobacterium swingsii TaxID=680026 RepID=A0A2T3PAQ9_9GAMM|nr:family 16 glycosylhydrolase [Photobacterium swingsii]PSW26057.1 1,3-beta-glucanase [Photobacterium swingsii]
MLTIKSLTPLALMACSFVSSSVFAANTNNNFLDPLETLNSEIWWKSDGWSNGFPFVNRWEGEAITFSEDQGMAITLSKTPLSDGSSDYQSGELRSHDFYRYGCFEAEIKPVNEPGVVSAFFLFAGPYDKDENSNGMHNEIDIEFLGDNTNAVQINYWTNDDRYENSNEKLIYLNFDASEDYHHYAIKWTKKRIKWYIDGELVHTEKNTPETPTPSAKDSTLRIMANVWLTDSRISNWAGEYTEAGQTPTAYFRNIRYTQGAKCEITPQ